MHPVGTNSAASLPKSSAARRSNRFTVGSSPYTSSPTSASAIARRISGVGRVTVSLRKSTIFSSGVTASGSLRCPLFAIVPTSPSSRSEFPSDSKRPLICHSERSEESAFVSALLLLCESLRTLRLCVILFSSFSSLLHQLHKHLIRNTQLRRCKPYNIPVSLQKPCCLQSLESCP